MGNDDRPKMSWREIDKARSGGGGRGSSSPTRSGGGPRTGGGGGRSTEDPHSKQYRAALEAAFAKGEMGKLADKLNLLSRGNPAEDQSRQAATPAAPPTGDKPSLSDRMLATAERVVATETAAAPSGEATDEAAKKKLGGKKKPGEDRPSLHRKLLEAPSRHEISKAAEKYLARFPMPDDHEFLEQLLDHEQDERIKEALTRITQLLDRRLPPRRTRALIGKLRYLTETNSDTTIRETAQTLLQRLS